VSDRWPLDAGHPLLPPVRTTLDADAVVLADLVDPDRCAETIAHAAAVGHHDASLAGRRLLAGLVDVAALVIAAPYLRTGRLVVPDPATTGFLLEGGITVRHVVVPDDAPRRAGAGSLDAAAATIADVLAAPIATICTTARLGSATARRLVADDLDMVVRLAIASLPKAAAQATARALLDAVAIEPAGRVRRLAVATDDGTVLLTHKRSCCAGPRDVSLADVCPTCPRLRTDDARAETTRAWLATLGDDARSALTATGRWIDVHHDHPAPTSTPRHRPSTTGWSPTA